MNLNDNESLPAYKTYQKNTLKILVIKEETFETRLPLSFMPLFNQIIHEMRQLGILFRDIWVEVIT